MSKKTEDLSKLSLSDIMKKYQEAEARASYYKAKSNRLAKAHKPIKQEEVEDDIEEEYEEE